MKCFATVYSLQDSDLLDSDYSQDFSVRIDHFLISFSNNILVIAIIFIIFEK